MILVVLSHYPDLFSQLCAGLDEHERFTLRTLIRDGDLIQNVPPNWHVIDAPQPFNYARNVNIAWSETGQNDIILMGDDVRVSGKFIRTLRETAYSDMKVGVACAQLWGQSPFVCGYFRRDVLDAVGPMDERYTGYGKEDMDWCRRMEALGYHTQPVEIPVAHDGGTSFWRGAAEGKYVMEEISAHNNRLFAEKWEGEGKAGATICSHGVEPFDCQICFPRPR